MFCKEILSERVKALRIEKQLKQIELGEALGLSKQTVSNWEVGIREPSLSALCDLADYFDVTLDYLVGRD